MGMSRGDGDDYLQELATSFCTIGLGSEQNVLSRDVVRRGAAIRAKMATYKNNATYLYG